MKYSDIIHFEPIEDVIQLDLLYGEDYRRDVVRNFVYPDYFLETILPQIVAQLKFGGNNQKGIQVIGNYGTGKTHLMSLVSLIAEHSDYLELMHNVRAREILTPIAGKFKTHWFELGTHQSLWDVIKYQLQLFLQKHHVDFTFEQNSLKMYRDQLEDMIAAFEEKYPGHGILLVVDEMLSYLRARSSAGMLDQDLPVLQAMGQVCAGSKFGFMFGVQEMIYQAREFAFAADMLLKVKDRYVDLTIRKEDVAFVVQNRMLQKTDEQKAAIREHLTKFTSLFSDMHGHLQNYVELYPVHPSFIDNFQKIRLGSSQREILKTISAQYACMKDDDVPADNPGLITYDLYWEQMQKTPANMAMPEFKTVADIVSIIHDKIESNFSGARAKQIPLAKRIANAAAVKLLQDNLSKRNGTRSETLADDLCQTSPIIQDRELLIDSIENCANLIVRATAGQYFEKNETNGEYSLRTEGGINFEQQVAQYSETMSPAAKDDAFFRFLAEALGITNDPYRTGFRIYAHELEWQSHRITRSGYIFMGHPNEKSTTHPKQLFYMIFMPIFQADKKQRNEESDEVYFVMDKLSDEFKVIVVKMGAAVSLMNSADQTQKPHYRNLYESYLKQASRAFETSYLDATTVYYTDSVPHALKEFSLPGGNPERMDIFNSVASGVFEESFTRQAEFYPKFDASQVITSGNRDRFVNNAKAKLVNPAQSNRDGEAILAALGCYRMGSVATDGSRYASNIAAQLAAKGAGKVLNRDEMIAPVANSDGRLWRSKDYMLEADLHFLVLAAMVVTGEVEICLAGGDMINASNIGQIIKMGYDDYYSFASVKRPKGVNLPLIKALTSRFCGTDLSNRLDEKSTYAAIVDAGRRLASEAATTLACDLDINALEVAGVELIPGVRVKKLKDDLAAFKDFADKMTAYTSEARLRNITFDTDTLEWMWQTLCSSREFKEMARMASQLENKVSYLRQALQYLPYDSALGASINLAVDQLVEAVDGATKADDVNVNNYIARLDDLKQQYVDWYLKQYNSLCLTELGHAEKTRLLNSMRYRVLEIWSCLPILNGELFNRIRADLMRMRTADPTVRSQLQRLPYAGFDPRTASSSQYTVGELRAEVDELFDQWIAQIRAFVAEDAQQQALALMDSDNREIARCITSGLEAFENENTAHRMADFIKLLCQGYERVELCSSRLSEVFSRPMTVEEAQKAFNRHLETIIRGKDTCKVRIVFTQQSDQI